MCPAIGRRAGRSGWPAAAFLTILCLMIHLSGGCGPAVPASSTTPHTMDDESLSCFATEAAEGRGFLCFEAGETCEATRTAMRAAGAKVSPCHPFHVTADVKD